MSGYYRYTFGAGRRVPFMCSGFEMYAIVLKSFATVCLATVASAHLPLTKRTSLVASCPVGNAVEAVSRAAVSSQRSVADLPPSFL